ncbi:MAG: hypothetical protein ALECFALPRED_001719 [Alectoria fallacina]|uniref:Uncharacterized protein n=1 Tax=Alectoria fallacina TaxID=1903189 RepID=A0A8H3IJJ6_9LECA|nr:MAG: hypothetical protein ALECFALPRED_001719 [Alectoria fallacina]
MSSPSAVVVLITGANSGIGYAASKVIASASAKYHVIMASRSIEKGNAACSAIQAAGIKGTTSSIQLDVTDESSIAAAVKAIESDHGRLDVLVNNAGIASRAPTLKEQLERTFSTNVVGAAIVAEAFTPLLLKSAEPYLLHISSTLGSLSLSGEFDYGIDARAYRMSKAALNMLMVRVSMTLGKHGVKVFAVCPGLVESNLRGEGAQERSAGGKAGDPEVSGQTILRIMEGGRDADVGRLVNKDGVVAW